MEWLRRLDENPLTERVIMALIFIQCRHALGLRDERQRDGALTASLLIAVDRIAIAIFVVEILAVINARRLLQRRVLGISSTRSWSASRSRRRRQPSPVLRALRVLRLLRLDHRGAGAAARRRTA